LDEAIAAIPPETCVGYDNDETVAKNFELMCRVAPADGPVLTLLQRLLPEAPLILDAGGHMGTKYRAFSEPLALGERAIDWIVWDTPAAVRAGRRQAEKDGLTRLSFVNDLAEAPAADILLCSGLLQYLDIPFSALVAKLAGKPRHLILNKVATRDGPTVVMLEAIGPSEVAYQVRDRRALEREIDALGYDIVEQWELPDLSHVIAGNPGLGSSTSRGYYAKLR
jgi:putative methyltransferase (TIGR04325 family)